MINDDDIGYEENYIDEKDYWEAGNVCKFCGYPLPEVIHGEFECPECGAIYGISGPEIIDLETL